MNRAPALGGRAESTPALRPSVRPRMSLALQKAASQTMPRRSPFPYLSLSWSCKQISTLSGMCTGGFQSCHPLPAASLSGSGMHGSQSPPSRPRTMCHATPDHSVPEAGAREAQVPVWAPASRSGLPSMRGLSLWCTESGPTITPPVHSGSRARGPECPNVKSPGRELAPSSETRE